MPFEATDILYQGCGIGAEAGIGKQPVQQPPYGKLGHAVLLMIWLGCPDSDTCVQGIRCIIEGVCTTYAIQQNGLITSRSTWGGRAD